VREQEKINKRFNKI